MRRAVWAAWANTFGLWHEEPEKCAWHNSLETWWAKNRNEEVKRLGQEVNASRSYVCFSSPSKKDVELWLKGFKAARGVLRGFYANS